MVFVVLYYSKILKNSYESSFLFLCLKSIKLQICLDTISMKKTNNGLAPHSKQDDIAMLHKWRSSYNSISADSLWRPLPDNKLMQTAYKIEDGKAPCPSSLPFCKSNDNICSPGKKYGPWGDRHSEESVDFDVSVIFLIHLEISLIHLRISLIHHVTSSPTLYSLSSTLSSFPSTLSIFASTLSIFLPPCNPHYKQPLSPGERPTGPRSRLLLRHDRLWGPAQIRQLPLEADQLRSQSDFSSLRQPSFRSGGSPSSSHPIILQSSSDDLHKHFRSNHSPIIIGVFPTLFQY